MAKKQVSKSGRDDVAVKIDRTVADKAKFVAARKGSTLAAYLTDIVSGVVEKDFAKALKDMEGSK